MNKYPNNWKEIRKKVIDRDNGKCVFCGWKSDLHVHHIRPMSMGGNHELYNLITLCNECHKEDHRIINEDGLSTIPGPEWEDHRKYLTDYDDVNKLLDKLERRGFDVSVLRKRNYEIHKGI